MDLWNRKFLQKKKIRADLYFWTVDLNFLRIVDDFMAYNLLKFQIDSTKIEA